MDSGSIEAKIFNSITDTENVNTNDLVNDHLMQTFAGHLSHALRFVNDWGGSIAWLAINSQNSIDC